ncbi:hypothetical protein JSO56_05015 [Riemerella anatipestifer]|uniref:hypothetical protein n=1 Tax=Riemerella anatipestifer TaxID=34085 RepID=UPI0030C3DE07
MSLTEAKTALYQEILDILEYEATVVETPEQSRVRIARGLTNAIDKFIRAGRVEIKAGIAVATTGSAISQTGATTEIGTGKII